MSDVRSERASLATILTLCNAADRMVMSLEASCGDLTDTARLRQIVGGIREEARALQGQVMHGVHTNPPLAVYLNPPMRIRMKRSPASGLGVPGITFAALMSHDVHEIRYTHIDDGKDYRHTFEGRAEMNAIVRRGKHDILITSGDESIPLWQDFK